MRFSRIMFSLVVVAFLSFAFLAPAGAQPFPEKKLPPALAPWVPWVLDDAPERMCTPIENSPVCAWLGQLDLRLSARGGQFTQQVQMDREAYVQLPGDDEHWPQKVLLDRRPATVIIQDGVPVTKIPVGAHTLSGEFFWNTSPESLHIPQNVGLISLSLSGRAIVSPRRDEEGLLWLESATSTEDKEEKLDLIVTRKIADGVPLTISTHLNLRASGKAREANLGKVLLPQTKLLAINSPLPAQIDAENNLRVQIRAGAYELEIVARTIDSPAALTLPESSPPLPATEVWVWQADEKLRQVIISGAPSIDPSRTTLPEGWRQYPAYQLSAGQKLQFSTTRLGEPTPPPDKLNLQRDIWLDLDGTGYTMLDKLSGQLKGVSRLDLLPPGELGLVKVDSQNQVITKSPRFSDHLSAIPTGVELRNSNLNLVAQWRLNQNRRAIPAVGWSENVQALQSTLHLPPGWTLIGARGVDSLPGTWWDEWNLFNLFFVIIIALAIGKLINWQWGIVALVAMILAHQQPDPPSMVWFSLLPALALIKILPTGKIKLISKAWLGLSFLWLAINLIPFTITQMRLGLFPQIAEESEGVSFMEADSQGSIEDGNQLGEASGVGGIDYLRKGRGAPAAKEEREEIPSEEAADKIKPKKAKAAQEPKLQAQAAPAAPGASAIRYKRKSDVSSYAAEMRLKQQAQQQQDPNAIVQTGHGLPNWRWRSWPLTWNGPVTNQQEIRLILISPRVNLLLAIVRVLLFLALLVGLIREAQKAGAFADALALSKKLGSATSTTAFLLALIFPGLAFGQTIPNEELLKKMQEKLLRQDACEDECVINSLLQLNAQAGKLTLQADLHAAARRTWRIPGPVKNWTPTKVMLDGKNALAISLQEDGFLHVRLEPGRHQLTVEGVIPQDAASLTLQVPDEPKLVRAQMTGYEIVGINEDGQIKDSIEIVRQKSASADKDQNAAPATGATSARVSAPWLQITREVEFALPWKVTTTVRRISETGSPLVVRVPLLAGESVNQTDLQIEKNEAVVSFSREEETVSWNSTLAETKEFSLTAAQGKSWSEIWRIKCGPIWQCTYQGINPVQRHENSELQPLFRPWPGEKIAVQLTRPMGAPGQSMTIDAAELILKPGERLTLASLLMRIRGSRGGIEKITLPSGAALQTLKIDGEDYPYRKDGDVVSVMMQPGAHRVLLDWQQSPGISWRYRVPQVHLGQAAVNAKINLQLPPERWLLWTAGPAWGPAILFWGFLLTILLGGWLLGWIPQSPLKKWQWLLLVVGLTQVPLAAGICLVGWFFALTWRALAPPQRRWLHNGLQIILVLWTIVAAGCLIGAIYSGLVVQPDMQVAGQNCSNTNLLWYMDRISDALPSASVISLPIIIWKMLMLLWALWLAYSIVRWAPWAWRCFSAEVVWRPRPSKLANP